MFCLELVYPELFSAIFKSLGGILFRTTFQGLNDFTTKSTYSVSVFIKMLSDWIVSLMSNVSQMLPNPDSELAFGLSHILLFADCAG